MASKAAVFFALLSLVYFFSFTLQQKATKDLYEVTTVISPETGNSSLRILSRKRRYVVFPKGSSIQCVSKQNIRILTPLTRRFRLGMNLGLAWRLPTEAHELYLQKRDVGNTQDALAHTGYGVLHRVDMFRMLELVFSVNGLKGRDCLMRAVCEASKARKIEKSPEQQRGSFMEELHKIMFSLPYHHKHKTDYDKARDQVGSCGTIYSSCPSILDLEM